MIFFVLKACFSYAQLNLVPNSGFELFNFVSNINPYACDVDSNVLFWFTPSKDNIHAITGASEYINNKVGNTNCTNINNIGGHQNPYNGDAYVGIVLRGYNKICDYRENIEIKLQKPLESNVKYECKIHYVFGEYMFYFTGTHQLGMLFTDTVIKRIYDSSCIQMINFYPIITIPQIAFEIKNPIDSINWKEESASFIAKGGEQYLTIGSFENVNPIPDNIYLFLDDISVIPIYPAQGGGNRKLCKGDSVLIGSNNYEEYKYSWFKKGSADTLSHQGQLWIKPDTTTTYILHQYYENKYFSSDTIMVDVSNTYCNKQNSLLVFPNPSAGDFLFQTKYPINGDVLIEVYDILGRKVKECKFSNNPNGIDFPLNMRGFGSGAYFYQMKFTEGRFSGRLMVVK